MSQKLRETLFLVNGKRLMCRPKKGVKSISATVISWSTVCRSVFVCKLPVSPMPVVPSLQTCSKLLPSIIHSSCLDGCLALTYTGHLFLSEIWYVTDKSLITPLINRTIFKMHWNTAWHSLVPFMNNFSQGIILWRAL